MIKPVQKRIWQFIKSKTSARLFLHSCGSVRRFIPDLIEIGVDILNPVQVAAAEMDPAELKREYGKDLTFWGGGCDTQRVLTFGRRTTWSAKCASASASWARVVGSCSTRFTIFSRVYPRKTSCGCSTRYLPMGSIHTPDTACRHHSRFDTRFDAT